MIRKSGSGAMFPDASCQISTNHLLSMHSAPVLFPSLPLQTVYHNSSASAIVFSESGVNVSDRLSFVVIDDPIQHLVIVKHDIGCRVRIAAGSLLGEVCVIGHLDLQQRGDLFIASPIRLIRYSASYVSCACCDP